MLIIFIMDALLQQQIEAVLFWKQEPMSLQDICSFLSLDNKEKVKKSIGALRKKYNEDTTSGIRLISDEQTYALVTDNCISEKIALSEEKNKDKELSKAALETLAIILYRGPVTTSVSKDYF